MQSHGSDHQSSGCTSKAIWFHQLLAEQPRDDGARRAGRALHRHGQCQRGPCASVARRCQPERGM